jgi:hypothetical protein
MVKREINNMIREFLDHPVTREIAAGPKARNISQTIITKPEKYRQKGNLFALLGFKSETDPVARLSLLIRQKTKVEFVGVKNNRIQYRILLPTDRDLIRATRLNWGDRRSWVTAVEQGVSGVTRFMYDRKKKTPSRSGYAFQLESTAKPNKKGRFRNRKYLTQIFNNFSKRVRSYKFL